MFFHYLDSPFLCFIMKLICHNFLKLVKTNQRVFKFWTCISGLFWVRLDLNQHLRRSDLWCLVFRPALYRLSYTALTDLEDSYFGKVIYFQHFLTTQDCPYGIYYKILSVVTSTPWKIQLLTKPHTLYCYKKKINLETLARLDRIFCFN